MEDTTIHVGVMSKTEIANLFNISTKTVERSCKEGRLPKPFYLGARSPRWKKSDIYAIYENMGRQTESRNSSR